MTGSYGWELRTLALVWLDWVGRVNPLGAKTKSGSKEMSGGRGRMRDLRGKPDVWPKFGIVEATRGPRHRFEFLLSRRCLMSAESV